MSDLKRIWARWIEPRVKYLTQEQTENARIVAGMSLIIWSISILGFVLSLPVISRGGLPMVLMIFVVICLFGVPYMLARYGRPRTAILLNCVLATNSIFAASLITSDEIALNALHYLVTVCIYAASFLTLRTAGVLAIGYSVLVLLLGPAFTDQPFEIVLAGPFTFNVVGASFTLLFVHYWRLREDRKRKALEVSEARYRAVSEHMSDYMFFARFRPDDSRTIVWENDQFKTLTGYTTEELGDDKIMRLIHPDDRLPVLAGREHIRQGEATSDEVRMTRRDGEERWLRIERLPVFEDGTMVATGYYGIVIDITEERNARQTQEELTLRRAQFSMIDTFVKAISHDFRNRLSSIETTRYLIGRQVSPESLERIKPRLEQISTHIDDMMTQLTNLTLINALNSPYLHPVSVNDLCRDVCMKFEYQSRGKSLEMHLELADDQPMLTADAEQLERALAHLVRNALTHTQQGGVTLRTMVEPDWAIIEVEDTGCGIDARNLPLIFEPFYRGDEARTVTSGGIGLGLTLVRLIVEAHHGTIDVESQLDHGTTFRIALPIRVRSEPSPN